MTGLDLGNLVINLVANSSRFDKVMSKAEGRITAAANRLTAVGTKMTLAITAPLLTFGAVATNEFAKFDKAMVESVSIMSDVTPEVRRQMEGVVRAISSKSVKAPEELARSYFFLASAGLNATQSMAALPVVTKFATAGAFDMALATDLLTDAQSALGLTVKDSNQNMENMTRLADVLVRANTLANASVEQFSRALTNKAAAAARLLGKDVEEAVAVLATFADQGVKDVEAGEKLNIVFRDLQTASIKQRDEWKKMGLATFDATGDMMNMADIIGQLEGKFKGMSDEQLRMALMTLGFQDRSVAAIMNLLGTSDKMREYEKQLRSASGYTESVATKQMEAFSNQLKVLKNNLTLVAIEIGGILAPGILALNDKIMKGVEWWQKLNEEQKKFLVNVGKVAAVTGPALVIFSKMLLLAGNLTFHLKVLAPVALKLWNAFRMFGLVAALPFLKIIAVVGLVVGAIAGLLYLIVGPEGMARGWETVSTAVSNFARKAWGFLSHFRENVGILVTWLKDNWRQALIEMGSVVVTFVTNAVHNFVVMHVTAIRIFSAFLGWLVNHGPSVFKEVFTVWLPQMAVEGVMKAGAAIINFAKDFVTTIKGAIQVVTTMLGEWGKNFIQQMGMIGAQTAKVLIQALTTGVSPEEIAKLVKMVSSAAAEGVQKAAEVAKAGADFLAKNFQEGASNRNFLETMGRMWEEGTDQMKTPLEGFQSELKGPQFNFGEEVVAQAETAVDSVKALETAFGDLQAETAGGGQVVADVKASQSGHVQQWKPNLSEEQKQFLKLQSGRTTDDPAKRAAKSLERIEKSASEQNKSTRDLLSEVRNQQQPQVRGANSP